MRPESEPQRKADNLKSRAMLARVIKTRTVDALTRNKIVETNYVGLKSSLKKTWQKRGILDGGGKFLNWLFRVSTTDELETVSRRVDRLSTEKSANFHELEAHTTLINETVWEDRASLKTMDTLRRTRLALDKEVAGIGGNQEQTATGIFSHGGVSSGRDPDGIKISQGGGHDGGWGGGGLPRTAANDSMAVRYKELSDYLAVATDWQTFIEMTAEETYRCRQDMTIVCPINRDIEKKCTESLRPGDFRGGVSEKCTTTTTPWIGQMPRSKRMRKSVNYAESDSSSLTEPNSQVYDTSRRRSRRARNKPPFSPASPSVVEIAPERATSRSSMPPLEPIWPPTPLPAEKESFRFDSLQLQLSARVGSFLYRDSINKRPGADPFTLLAQPAPTRVKKNHQGKMRNRRRMRWFEAWYRNEGFSG
ncbi:hypothetical protein DAPPUDRAFT_102753 [Daphnia pulex]|uniref:Uncharacterized protein n=1 Tax=Daphnia pulex TaxID=6669 RepID=E9GHE8_DAPPU|nr:hypothetical protein DAPPUDRAFT_102753 [Daphnia pulex]|eukprot:EFX81192.1 hypothetical protein DAPPUDRAFT_102753 [Daphnia pulex]